MNSSHPTVFSSSPPPSSSRVRIIAVVVSVVVLVLSALAVFWYVARRRRRRRLAASSASSSSFFNSETPIELANLPTPPPSAQSKVYFPPVTYCYYTWLPPSTPSTPSTSTSSVTITSPIPWPTHPYAASTMEDVDMPPPAVTPKRKRLPRAASDGWTAPNEDLVFPVPPDALGGSIYNEDGTRRTTTFNL